jgi:hypothetical protein
VTLPIKQRLIKIVQELFDYVDRNQGKIRNFFRGIGDHIQDAVDTGKALLTVFGQLPEGVQQTAGSLTKLAVGLAPIASVVSSIAGMVVQIKSLGGVQRAVADNGSDLAKLGQSLIEARKARAAEAAEDIASDFVSDLPHRRRQAAAENTFAGIVEAAQARSAVTVQAAATEARALQSVSQAYRAAAASGTKFAGVQAGMMALSGNIKTVFAGSWRA